MTVIPPATAEPEDANQFTALSVLYKYEDDPEEPAYHLDCDAL